MLQLVPQLARGARLVEILKQPQYSPLPVEEQIISLFAVTTGLADKIEVSQIREFEVGMHKFLKASHADLITALKVKFDMDADLTDKFKKAITKFGDDFTAGLKAKQTTTPATGTGTAKTGSATQIAA